MKVNWDSSVSSDTLKFSDLKINQSFSNVRGKGAVYVKVIDQAGTYWMYEIATGKLWTPTLAPVKIVDVSVSIAQKKPALRNYY